MTPRISMLPAIPMKMLQVSLPSTNRMWTKPIVPRPILALLKFALLCVLLCLAKNGARAQATGPAPDAATVKTHLKQILSQPEFQPDDADSPGARMAKAMRDRLEKMQQWISDRWNAFQRWLKRLFSFAGPAGSAVSSAFSIVLVIVLLIFGGWFAAWLIRNFWINRQAQRSRERTAFDEAEGDEDVAAEPGAWLQQGSAFAAGGDFRRAFRSVFLAILLQLDHGGIIEFDKARTNGDYARVVRRKRLYTLSEILDPLVLEFDLRWYGRQATTEADYRAILVKLERIRNTMNEPSPPAAFESVERAQSQ